MLLPVSNCTRFFWGGVPISISIVYSICFTGRLHLCGFLVMLSSSWFTGVYLMVRMGAVRVAICVRE